jgi:hypothetical protein
VAPRMASSRICQLKGARPRSCRRTHRSLAGCTNDERLKVVWLTQVPNNHHRRFESTRAWHNLEDSLPRSPADSC